MPWGVAAAAVAAGGAIYSSNKAASASKDAANTAADAQETALGYQQSVEAMPLAYRDAAMPSLAAEYGMTMDSNGNVVSDGTTIEQRATSSPFYTGMLEAGESAIGRNASATGRLRGGAVPTELGANAQNAYMNAYNQQLQGLSSFSNTALNTNSIANSMSSIGGTIAQGDIAAAQAEQQGTQSAFNAIGAGLTAYGNRTTTPTTTG